MHTAPHPCFLPPVVGLPLLLRLRPLREGDRSMWHVEIASLGGWSRWRCAPWLGNDGDAALCSDSLINACNVCSQSITRLKQDVICLQLIKNLKIVCCTPAGNCFYWIVESEDSVLYTCRQLLLLDCASDLKLGAEANGTCGIVQFKCFKKDLV